MFSRLICMFSLSCEGTFTIIANVKNIFRHCEHRKHNIVIASTEGAWQSRKIPSWMATLAVLARHDSNFLNDALLRVKS